MFNRCCHSDDFWNTSNAVGSHIHIPSNRSSPGIDVLSNQLVEETIFEGQPSTILCAFFCPLKLELFAQGGDILWCAGVVWPVAHHLIIDHGENVCNMLLVAFLLQLLAEMSDVEASISGRPKCNKLLDCWTCNDIVGEPWS